MPFKKIKKVSVVIPVYNEEQNLPKLLERTLTACHKLKQKYELILVDDGSIDNSSNLIINAAKNLRNNIIAVILNRNYGQHFAIMIGFKQTTGDFIITLDADLQNPPEEIPNLVQIGEQGYDLVSTKRVNRQDSWFRKIASKFINNLIIKITGRTIGDYGCMLRAYRRNVINAMLQCHKFGMFIPILANNFAKRTVEIDVTHSERKFGNSKYNFLKLINLMFDLFASLTTNSLDLLSFIGSCIMISGFLLVVLLIILHFIFTTMWIIEIIFILFAILFVFVGIQFIIIRLLYEYSSIMYNSVYIKQPNFFIQQIVGISRNFAKNKKEK